MTGEYSTGGSRPTTRRRVSDDEWAELTAERKAPAAGKGVPIGIIRRPVQLPPVVNIQRGEDIE